MTTAEAKALMRAEVARIAEKACQMLGIFSGGDCGWPTEPSVVGGRGVHEYIAATTERFAFAIRLNREAVIVHLDNEIERTGDDSIALSAEAHAARIA